MTEINRLSQKQENAVYELFNTYQQEYKQDPGHIAKVLNEINAARQRPNKTASEITGNPPASSELLKYGLNDFGPPNPLKVARMDREAALIELAIAAVKIDNHDGQAASILRQDATLKRHEAERLNPEVQTDVALNMLDLSLSKQLPQNQDTREKIQNPFLR